MNRKMHMVFYGNDHDLPPLIATFTLPDDVEEEDVHIVFSKELSGWNPLLDCPWERFAADAVCFQLGTTVEFAEASQVYGAPSSCRPSPRCVYQIIEFRSDENVVDTTCYASEYKAIEAWRNGFGTADSFWDVIEEMIPDKYYRARSSLDMSNYYERKLVKAPVID